jgi:hypothetical protein
MRTPAVTLRAIQPGDWLERQWPASPARLPRSITAGLIGRVRRRPGRRDRAAQRRAVVADPGDPPADVIGPLELLRYRVLRQGDQSATARSPLRGADRARPRAASRSGAPADQVEQPPHRRLD